MSKKRKASDKELPEAPKTKIKAEPGLEPKTRYSDDQHKTYIIHCSSLHPQDTGIVSL